MKIKTSDKVLRLLKKIPHGKVTTYAALAKAASTSPRAIGSILRSNNHPEKYPCYKVVMSSGKIGGYCSSRHIKKKIVLLRKDGIVIKDGKIDLEKFGGDFRNYSFASKHKRSFIKINRQQTIV